MGGILVLKYNRYISVKVKSLPTPYLYYMTSKVTSLCSLEKLFTKGILGLRILERELTF